MDNRIQKSTILVAVLTVTTLAGAVIAGDGYDPITHKLSFKRFNEGEIQVSLSTTDKAAVGVVVRDRNQGRNLIAFLTDQSPEGSESLFGLLSAESIARVGSPSLGDLQISFLVELQFSDFENIELAIIKNDGSVVAIPMDLVGFDGNQVTLEITEEETKADGGCLTYNASSSSCGSFSATCCGGGQVCIDYTACTITCSGCVS